MTTETITTAPDQYTIMLEHYASIVEKTNNQLGLSLNVSSIAVAILSAFIAILAIGVAYYIWKNSKEQKDLFKNFLIENKKNIDEQNSILMEQKKLELEKAIKELEKLKDSVTDTETKKIELQKLIDDLKKEKSAIGFKKEPSKVFIDDSYVSTNSYLSLDNKSEIKSMFCSECGKSFEYYEENPSVYSTYLNITPNFVGLGGRNKKVHCSYCNAVNIPK